MDKRGSVNYFIVFFIMVAFIAIIAYGADEYTGFVVYTSCDDSDFGLDYYEKGTVTAERAGEDNIIGEDECRTGGRLKEWYCDDNRPKRTTYYCPAGCENGACVYETATSEEIVTQVEDECSDYSDCGGPIRCGDGSEFPIWVCRDGKCSQISYLINPCSGVISGGVQPEYPSCPLIPDINQTSCRPGDCLYDDRCYSEGETVGRMYCDGYSFIRKKSNFDSCNNGYECSNNRCGVNLRICMPVNYPDMQCSRIGEVITYGGDSWYCTGSGISTRWNKQVGRWSSCSYDYECESGNCQVILTFIGNPIRRCSSSQPLQRS